MKKKLFVLLPLVAVTLSGCSFLKRLFFGEESTTQQAIVFPDPVIIPNRDGCSTYQFTYQHLAEVQHTVGSYPLQANSDGQAKLLVVPVQFKNSSNAWGNAKRDWIRKCFFGDPTSDSLPWESVSSYYTKSSYGKMNIVGEIAPTFTSSLTYAQIDTKQSPDVYIVEEFQSSSVYRELRKQYDGNGDGYIDAVAFVYAEMFRQNDTERWWAHVNTHYDAKNVDNPVVNQYMWTSFYFSKLTSNVYGAKYDYDTHTYIHETGHLLGLDDYYNYSNDNYYDPSGGQEMHSQNIGDENIYSKMCLGWIEPYYVKATETTSSLTLTLNSSAHYSQGNAIILNDNWNGTPMDEYIIIEYYSPTDLNKKDSESKYARNAQMFQTSGFRIYHVDSRLVAYEKVARELTPSDFVSRINSIDTTYFNFIGASNSPIFKRSWLPDETERENFKQIHLLQAGGVNTLKNGHKADDSDLFKEGAEFVANSNFFYKGTKFNAGNEVGYKITIGKCEGAQGTLTISKI